MAVVSRGFGGRREPTEKPLPPGQFLTEDFPVLSAGPTPNVDESRWEFSIHTETGEAHRWDWAALQAMDAEDVSTDIHCVTRWSKLGTGWRGVPLDAFFADVETEDDFVMAHSYGGYTTNLPLDDLLDGKAWLAYEFEGEPLAPVHGGPVRLLVPHLYFWKSAKWIRSLVTQADDVPGFWEQNGYHAYGDPWLEQRYS
ncbi:DMSO/TMAO reductase YedYZ molybdopterin-dependent catalytic subunit [Sediminihabitans luteus]|uniref:DMSO/TMAO reductase YedYZ molybdopterin-dependent catalytic subunit n=1 Tax=Sediminihabitans luteus TaxID=1138585 RepID=A0A2M9CEB5_9CELL|nr:sulfite oxidase-like oxidoreductase [Sediminihabitans luteus]PJJ70271.1 DMSO/TMAO reductase YedYZ molybdopterin-dependent catalytic subunit [Sediminihabitans luteus]GII97742.1 molybdopterin-binding protein [Sediminihabitans luteus]